MQALLLMLRAQKWFYPVVAALLMLGVTGAAAATGTGSALVGAVTGSNSTPGAAPAAGPTPTAGSGGTPTTTATSSGNPAATGANSGPRNIVQVANRKDGDLRVDGQVQLNKIPGTNASPENRATAYSSCVSCQTYAVALQVNLIARTAQTVAPQNAAVALNFQCNGCYTEARAIQYDISVDDPTQVPPRVQQLVNAMNQELNVLRSKQTTAADARAGIDRVIAQFTEFAQYLHDQSRSTTDGTTPNVTPFPTDTPAPAASPGASDTPTETDTPTPGATTTDTPTASVTGTPTATDSPTASPTP